MDLSIEIFDRAEGAVGQMMAFEIAPAALDVVEFRGVLGQPFDTQPWPIGKGFGGELAGVNRAVIEHEHDRGCRSTDAGSALSVELFEQTNKVRAALGGAGQYGQLLAGSIKQAEHGPLTALPRRLDAQIGATLSPDMGEIGMREGFGFVLEEQPDVARLSLLTQQT